MDRVIEYVNKHYPRKFKGKNILVDDCDSHYRVYCKDGSPLILSKNI